MIPSITPCPAAEVDAIHEASLRVLAEVGVTFPHAGAQELLAEAGALLAAAVTRRVAEGGWDAVRFIPRV